MASDIRKTLLGNWGLAPYASVQTLIDRLAPGGGSHLQTVLLRPPVQRESNQLLPDDGLTRKLSGLASIKGEDLLLHATSEQLVRHHRLRASVPSKLWKWREVSGRQWKTPAHKCVGTSSGVDHRESIGLLNRNCKRVK